MIDLLYPLNIPEGHIFLTTQNRGLRISRVADNGHSKSAAQQAEENAREWFWNRVNGVEDDTVGEDVPEDSENDLFGGINPEIIDGAELAEWEEEVQYLVEKCVIRGQVGAFGGPDKALKTSVMVDLAVSVVSGQPFLDRYEILETGKVGIFSCERGRPSLKKLENRIAKAKGVDRATLKGILWGHKPPNLCDPEWIRWLRNWIVENDLKLLLLDPAYLMIGGMEGLTSNVYSVGSGYIKDLIDLAESTNCTVLPCVHFRKLPEEQKFAPPERNWMSGSGWAEMVRMWFLFNRFSTYDRRDNQVWVKIGSSEGGEDNLVLAVDEGTENSPTWDFDLLSPNDARVERSKRNEARKEARKESKRHEKAMEVHDVLNKMPDGMTENSIKYAVGGALKTIKEALKYLEDGGVAERCKVMVSSRERDGWRAVG